MGLTITSDDSNESVQIETDVNGRLEVTFDKLTLGDLISQLDTRAVLDEIDETAISDFHERVING